MSIQPLFNRILLKVPSEETVTKSGLVLVKKEEDQVVRGTVVAIGPGSNFEDKIIPTVVKVGDEVIFVGINRVNIEDSGEKYSMISENEILAIITPKKHKKD